MTTELVEGRTLADIVSTGGMPVERLLKIAIPLADAVAAAHDRGLMHRDLKPGRKTRKGRQRRRFIVEPPLDRRWS